MYPGYILAQVEVATDYDRAIGAGFSILAHYIFGGNRRRSKIAMTAQVSGENISGSEKIPMTVPVTEEEVGGSEKMPMAAPVTEEQMDKSEKLAMTTPVTEEKTGKDIFEYHLPYHPNIP